MNVKIAVKSGYELILINQDTIQVKTKYIEFTLLLTCGVKEVKHFHNKKYRPCGWNREHVK